MKLIITESQYKKILSEDINSDNKIINALKEKINRGIDEFVSKNKTSLDKSSKILDANSIVSQFKNYLISQTPSLLQQMKTGKGGDVFVQNTLNKLLSLVESELKKIGWLKKKSIQALSPSKEELKKTLEGSSEFDNYFQMFVDLVDFPFVISMMDEVQPYLTKINNFDDQKNEWLKKNRKIIKN